MTDRKQFSYDRLWAEQLRIASKGKIYIFGYVVFTTALYTYIDIEHFDSYGWNVFASIATWVFGYLLFVWLMHASGSLAEGRKSGIGTYFALGVLSGIAILVGILLLILPGLYLTMRWLPSFPRAMAEGHGIQDALRWSWDQTRDHQRVLSIMLVWPVLFYFVGTGFAAIYDFQWETISWTVYGILMAGLNLSLAIGFAWLTILGVATYRLLSSYQGEVREAFA